MCSTLLLSIESLYRVYHTSATIKTQARGLDLSTPNCEWGKADRSRSGRFGKCDKLRLGKPSTCALPRLEWHVWLFNVCTVVYFCTHRNLSSPEATLMALQVHQAILCAHCCWFGIGCRFLSCAQSAAHGTSWSVLAILVMQLPTYGWCMCLQCTVMMKSPRKRMVVSSRCPEQVPVLGGHAPARWAHVRCAGRNNNPWLMIAENVAW